MELDVIRMVLPVLVMIGIGYFCNRKQIFDMNGLKGLKALLGDIMLPVRLFNAFFTAAYSVRVVVVFLVVFIGYGIAIALGYVLRPAVKPYGKYLPFLLASAEGGMLGYALYGLIVGSQSGFAAVDLGPVSYTHLRHSCLQIISSPALMKVLFILSYPQEWHSRYLLVRSMYP